MGEGGERWWGRGVRGCGGGGVGEGGERVWVRGVWGRGVRGCG